MLVAELEDPSGPRPGGGGGRGRQDRRGAGRERGRAGDTGWSTSGSTPSSWRRSGTPSRASTPANDQGELYLTDVLETIGRRSRAVTYTLKNPEEANLVNDRAQLARAEEILRRRILDAHMRAGVTVRDPASTHIEATVEIGRDTVILPGSFLRGETKIGSDCVIGPSADLLDTAVGDGAQVEHSVGRGAAVGRGRGRGALLLPAAGDGAGGGVEGRGLLRGQEHAGREGEQGAAPLVRRGRGDRGGGEPRGGDHHRQLRRAEQEPDHASATGPSPA